MTYAVDMRKFAISPTPPVDENGDDGLDGAEDEPFDHEKDVREVQFEIGRGGKDGKFEKSDDERHRGEERHVGDVRRRKVGTETCFLHRNTPKMNFGYPLKKPPRKNGAEKDLFFSFLIRTIPSVREFHPLGPRRDSQTLLPVETFTPPQRLMKFDVIIVQPSQKRKRFKQNQKT